MTKNVCNFGIFQSSLMVFAMACYFDQWVYKFLDSCLTWNKGKICKVMSKKSKRVKLVTLLKCGRKEFVDFWEKRSKFLDMVRMASRGCQLDNFQRSLNFPNLKFQRVEMDNMSPILLIRNMVVHGLLNRWTDIFILPRTAWGGPFNPYNNTQPHSIFVKL